MPDGTTRSLSSLNLESALAISLDLCFNRVSGRKKTRIQYSPEMLQSVDENVKNEVKDLLCPDQPPEIKSGSVTISLLMAQRFPLLSMGISFTCHAILLLLLMFAPFTRKKDSHIDFGQQTITYYSLSQDLPDVSSVLGKVVVTEKESGQEGKPKQPRKATSREEVAISRSVSAPTEHFVEVSEAKRIESLPKLELPNVLLSQPETSSVEEPISVTETVSRDLNEETKRALQQISSAQRKGAGVAVPLPSPQSPNLPDGTLRTPNLVPYASQRLTLGLPEEPPSVSPQVSHIPAPGKALSLGLPLWVPRPLNDPQEGIEVKGLASTNRAALLAYSPIPAVPRGELRVPKVRVAAGLASSPQGGNSPGLGEGAAEFGNAEIEIPSIAIKNRVPLVSRGTGLAVVQAPRPSLLVTDRKREEKPLLPPLQDLLPGPNRSFKLSRMEDLNKGVSSDSPLAEVERQGGQVYIAAINAPNFTSKQGSWIFRFAELLDASLPASAGSGEGHSDSEETMTAPSAIVKFDPRYSPEVIRDKIQGTVILYAVILKNGTVDPQSVSIIRKLDPRLDLSAKEALLGWRFRPSEKNGRPVDIQAEIAIPFYFRKDSLYP